MYAYFLTMTDADEPLYPYIVGPTMHGQATPTFINDNSLNAIAHNEYAP